MGIIRLTTDLEHIQTDSLKRCITWKHINNTIKELSHIVIAQDLN
mgnify:FL=1